MARFCLSRDIHFCNNIICVKHVTQTFHFLIHILVKFPRKYIFSKAPWSRITEWHLKTSNLVYCIPEYRDFSLGQFKRNNASKYAKMTVLLVWSFVVSFEFSHHLKLNSYLWDQTGFWSKNYVRELYFFCLD